MKFEVASCATKGARDYQEDTALLWPLAGGFAEPPALVSASASAGAEGHAGGGAVDGARVPLLLAVLADGMGGHVGGALASKTVCESFIATASAGRPDDGQVLLAALNAANGAVGETVSRRPELSGMGSTLVGVLFSEAAMQWISVGDSPLYLYRQGELALLNEDHSLAPALDQLARDGKISAEQARHDPRRHMLRSAVTGEDLELIDISRTPLRIEKEDLFIVASDGIHTLENEEIARVAAAYAGDGPLAVAKALIRAVEDMRVPHQDNTTIIVVQPVAEPATT